MNAQTRYLPLTAAAILALLFALWAGLLRLGWALPALPGLALAHGPLMISGFLGVLIPLERAVAIRQKWMFAVPLAATVGWVSLLFAAHISSALLTLASLGALAILGVMVSREPQLHTFTMALGTLAWVIGNFLWMLGAPIFQIVSWWMVFLVLTIGGERIELNRVQQLPSAQLRAFSGMVVALLTGALLSIFDLNWGTRLLGLSNLALSFWFLKNDLARRNLRHPLALTRYIALCLFSGFIWLGVGGALQLYYGALYAGPLYDAALHAVFVGFVISMIFGHAPIIFPAILGKPIVFLRAFYIHLILLHTSLFVRVIGGLLGNQALRRWGGLFNEVAILLFLGATVYSILRRRM